MPVMLEAKNPDGLGPSGFSLIGHRFSSAADARLKRSARLGRMHADHSHCIASRVRPRNRNTQGGGGPCHWFCQSSPISLPDSESRPLDPASHEMAVPIATTIIAIRQTPRMGRLGATIAPAAARIPMIKKTHRIARRRVRLLGRLSERTRETTLWLGPSALIKRHSCCA